MRLGAKARRTVVDQGSIRGVAVEPDGALLPADAFEGLHMIGDYQSNPLVEASVRLEEESAGRIPMDRRRK